MLAYTGATTNSAAVKGRFIATDKTASGIGGTTVAFPVGYCDRWKHAPGGVVLRKHSVMHSNGDTRGERQEYPTGE
jgi:hypothetical protein